jgi:hypothetical protein
MRKKFFVSSFLRTQNKRKRTIKNANEERLAVINQLAQQGKRVILLVPKNLSLEEKELISRVSKKRNIRIKTIGKNNLYASPWIRDVFFRLKERVYNKDRTNDFGINLPKHLKRFFGEGGRVIDLGKVKGKAL